ncbi:SDR family NAD(P)-dependent oxidoreductase [Corallococcus macrosporus]|uniref:2-dehydro-3-deoxy-D-gluconate 5-dehydrogenase n=1 Tax=Corallococcus macrosporus DSM 14697 TaxID=1189310 RepID=A0A250JKX0_9BACT|nr:glucose 1-dehydrogenase [Corallococcus macrosporus]ATB44525.1 2-dehydro-3-deoxy-D-gluconate 5-dehydrogenase [Corallococcus macrosporus DSM 14697]
MSPSAFRLGGRRALITGASGGLGLHFAQVLAQAGAEVVLAARREDKLAAEVDRLRSLGARAHAVSLDVTSADSVRAAVAEAEARTGGVVDVLVNNAGVSGQRFFLQLEEAEWDTVVDTNLKGAYLVAREVARRLVEHTQPGSIINIASILGLRVSGSVSSYCASKAGLIQLTKAMALELARHGIRVNALAPGYIETDFNRAFFEGEAAKKLVARIPFRRLGQMRELDGPLLLLASEAGSYMSGSVLEVDGGHLCSTL